MYCSCCVWWMLCVCMWWCVSGCWWLRFGCLIVDIVVRMLCIWLCGSVVIWVCSL